jgi:hypothetical protein
MRSAKRARGTTEAVTRPAKFRMNTNGPFVRLRIAARGDAVPSTHDCACPWCCVK